MSRATAIGCLLLLVAAGCGDVPGTRGGTATSRGDSGSRGDTAGGPLVITGPTMGTQYSVKLYAPAGGADRRALKTEIEQTLQRIDGQMSTWRADSELSRFNQSGSTEWFDVSDDTALVVEEALRISRLSGGALDVTVEPLLALWGFGPHPRPEHDPTKEAIAEVRQRIGYEKIHVRRAQGRESDPPGLRKDRGDVQVVLSAIAKGFAVDRVAELLDEHGATAYMVEIGGEVRTRGRKPDGGAWTIGIEKPVSGERAVQAAIELTDLALATSGDYRNFYKRDGRRYSHTIDPRTGRPVEHRLAAVSVVTDSCMTADAIATALMVLGPDDGYNWAIKQDLAAYFIVRDTDRFVEMATPRFLELFPQLREQR